MGILDRVVKKATDDLSYTAGSKIAKGVEKEAEKKLEAKKVKKCQSCNKEYPPGTKFCAQCGSNLS